MTTQEPNDNNVFGPVPVLCLQCGLSEEWHRKPHRVRHPFQPSRHANCARCERMERALREIDQDLPDLTRAEVYAIIKEALGEQDGGKA